MLTKMIVMLVLCFAVSPKGVSSVVGSPADRISFAELKIPHAKRSLSTATITVGVEGWEPVKGVPIDLLGCGTHVFKMLRMEVRRWGEG